LAKPKVACCSVDDSNSLRIPRTDEKIRTQNTKRKLPGHKCKGFHRNSNFLLGTRSQTHVSSFPSLPTAPQTVKLFLEAQLFHIRRF